jgi:SAM-dependent methyltransferase
MHAAQSIQVTPEAPLYDHGDLYDKIMVPLYEEAELTFYDAMARERRASILELGCGTGRLSLPLAVRGHTVTGVDCAQSMLALARSKAAAAGARVSFVQADIRQCAVGKDFGLVILPFNTLSHLYTLDDLWGCFSSVRSQLAADGFFVIDIDNPTPYQLGDGPHARHLLLSRVVDSGERLDVYETSVYDWSTQVHERSLFVQDRGREAQLNLRTRVFFPQELDNLLRCAGFKILRKFGSFGMEAFTATSGQQVLVCMKQKSGLAL